MPLLVAAALLTATLAGASPSPATPWFADITTAAGISALRHGEGVNIVDLDGDGLPELFLPCVRDRGRLLKNLGNGRFADVTDSVGVGEKGGVGAAVGDLDADGRPDIFVARGADPYVAPNLVYLQQADGHFRDASQTLGVAQSSSGLTVTLADFDGDGRQDAFLPGWGGDRLLHATTGGFSRTGAETVLGTPGRGWSSVASDFDGDGDLDLFVTRGSFTEPHDNRLYRNLGGGRFEDVTAASGLAGSPWSLGAISADFDNDGDFDLYVAGYSGPGKLYRNDGHGRFSDATPGSGLGAARAVGVTAGLIDDDLLPDLVVGGFAGPVEVYRNCGGLHFEKLSRAESGLQTHRKNEGLALADVDNDGDLDLYVANVEGHNRLYENRLDNPRYLKARFSGVSGPVEGSVARLMREGRQLAIQELQGAVGMGQGDAVFLFRLPDAGLFDLIVTPPGRKNIELKNIGPGQVKIPWKE